MAEFSKLVITNKGQALIAKMIAGSGNIDFTKICASSTTYTIAQLEVLTSLTNVKQTSLISKVTRTNEVAIKVETAFTNSDLTVGYYMRTLGLYAVDPDVGEILYAVTIETSGNCYMPPYNGVTVSGAYVQLVTTVGNAESVSLEVNQAAIATIGDIQELQKEIEVHTKKIDIIDSEKATKSEVQTERSRIDMFTSLPSGTVTNDAALADIAVGIDGTMYKDLNGNPAPGKAVRTQIGQLGDALQYSSVDVLSWNALRRDRVHNGITFTWNGDTCHAVGTATTMAAFVNLIESQDTLPTYLKAGKTYQVLTENLSDTIFAKVFFYENGRGENFKILTASGELRIPDACTGIILCFEVPAGATVDANVRIKILSAKSNEMLDAFCTSNISKSIMNMGILADESDLNVINQNSAYTLASNYTYQNAPFSGMLGTILTIIDSKTSMQIAIKNFTREVWHRYRILKDSSWKDWGRLNVIPSELDTIVDALETDMGKCLTNITIPTEKYGAATLLDNVPVNRCVYGSVSWFTDLGNFPFSTACNFVRLGYSNESSGATSSVIAIERSTGKLAIGRYDSTKNVFVWTMPMQRRFLRRHALFGDSITYGRDGDGASTTTTAYPIDKTIAESLGIDCVNYGIGGSGYLKPGRDNFTAYQKIASIDLSAFDSCSLAFGTNDVLTYTLGLSDSSDETEIMGQFNKIIHYLYTTYPKIQIIVIAPWNGRNVGTFPFFKYGSGEKMLLMADALKERCAYYNLPYIDQRDGSPINGYTIQQGGLIGADGVHPNDAGYKAIGCWLAGQLGLYI